METIAITKRQKNYCISLLRLIGTSFIVLCHFFQYYDVELAWWFNVGVQMFFCISGFLYANKKIDSAIDFISGNLQKILIPYLCFLIPTIAIYFIFAGDTITVSSAVSALLTSDVIEGIGHLWFIPYILFCYLITPYLQALAEKLRKTKWYVFCISFFALIVCGEIFFHAFDSYFVFNRIFCYLFGYFASVFLQEYGEKLYKILVCILTTTTLLLNCFRIYCKYINHFSFKGFSVFEGYSHALLGISIILFFLLFIKIKKTKKILELSDKYSFHIYLVHQLFILSPFSLLTVTSYKVLNWLLTILAILIAAILLEIVSRFATNCFKKYTNHFKKKVAIK